MNKPYFLIKYARKYKRTSLLTLLNKMLSRGSSVLLGFVIILVYTKEECTPNVDLVYDTQLRLGVTRWSSPSGKLPRHFGPPLKDCITTMRWRDVDTVFLCAPIPRKQSGSNTTTTPGYRGSVLLLGKLMKTK